MTPSQAESLLTRLAPAACIPQVGVAGLIRATCTETAGGSRLVALVVVSACALLMAIGWLALILPFREACFAPCPEACPFDASCNPSCAHNLLFAALALPSDIAMAVLLRREPYPQRSAML